MGKKNSGKIAEEILVPTAAATKFESTEIMDCLWTSIEGNSDLAWIDM